MMRGTLTPIIVALMSLSATKADDQPSLAKKYEETVRIVNWAWSDEEAGLVHSLAQASSPYDLAVIRPAGGTPPVQLTFKVMDGRREVYTWSGHLASVFILRGERLYYLQETNDGRALIRAVDLKAGKELWTSPLRNMRPAAPDWFFTMRVILRANDEAIWVFTKTNRGRFFELKDAKTGETVGHKVFEEPSKEPR